MARDPMVRGKWAFAAAVACALAFAPAAYAEAPVAVGEVATVAGQEDAAATIKTTLAEELAKVKVPAGRRFVVSVSLLKLETKPSGEGATTSCTISLAIRDAKSGAIRGVVNGSGAVTARGADPKQEQKRVAVESAVRGATRNLPILLAQ
jgi:hypothetical protein